MQRSVRDKQAWTQLVARVRSGPPFPLSLSLVDEPMNAAEYFVHLEDVRRAQPGWEPRQLDQGLERALWGRVKLMARAARRAAPVGLVLEAPGYGRVVVKSDTPSVTVTGPPSELLLLLFGRSPAVRLDMAGDDDAVAQVRQAKFGL